MEYESRLYMTSFQILWHFSAVLLLSFFRLDMPAPGATFSRFAPFLSPALRTVDFSFNNRTVLKRFGKRLFAIRINYDVIL